MKPNHRQNILEDFHQYGTLSRDKLMGNRKRYGLHFDRRIRELDKEHQIERIYKDDYIERWIYVGPWDGGQLELLSA